MVIKCCVFGCANVYKKKHRKLEGDKNFLFLSFHRFPTNPKKKINWISNVRQINGSTWQPMNSSFVCSKHFDCSSWEKITEDGKRKLKFQAVPSIFNNLSQKSGNDHNYSLEDITNSGTFSSMERNELCLSVPDHTYSSKAVCSNRNLFTLTASSIKETSVTTNTAEKNIPNTSEIESSLIVQSF